MYDAQIQDEEIETPEPIEIDDEKILALAQHLGIERTDEDILNISDKGNDTYKYGRLEYLVLTDEEADEKWDEYAEEYIDEMIRPLPEFAQNYFDREMWKRDARMDGRGASLSSYDGAENEAEIDGTWYYIYRVN